MIIFLDSSEKITFQVVSERRQMKRFYFGRIINKIFQLCILTVHMKQNDCSNTSDRKAWICYIQGGKGERIKINDAKTCKLRDIWRRESLKYFIPICRQYQKYEVQEERRENFCQILTIESREFVKKHLELRAISHKDQNTILGRIINCTFKRIYLYIEI